MEYLIKQIINTPQKTFFVERGKRTFQDYPSKHDEVTVNVSDKPVKTEIVNIERNTIFVLKITQ